MSSPKERHYWSQLRVALTAGQWRSEYPAKTPNNTPLSWSELFRKFNKHCRGYNDLTEVASQIQSLALLLSAKYKDDDEDGDALDEGSNMDGAEAQDDGWKRGKLALGSEGKLPEERIEEAMAGYEVLKSMDTSKFDTIHFSLAYYAYALGNYTECITHISKVPELLQFQNRIPNSDSIRSNLSQGLLAPSNYAPSTTSFAGSFASVIDLTAPEVRDGRGWAMAETFRSLCLKGMSYEMLYPSDPSMALKTYRSALPLFSALRSEFTPTSLPRSLSAAGKAEYTLFAQLREMWRWVERLLWRAVVLSAKTSDIFIEEDPSPTPTPTDRTSESQNSLWTWLGHYSACSAYWPPTFRTAHRSTICALHLRALVLRFGVLASVPTLGTAPTYVQASKTLSSSIPGSRTPSRPPTALSTTNPTTPASATPSSYASSFGQPPTQLTWMHTARTVAQDYRAILSASTTFPRAGERNVKVEEFVELCAKVWEVGGAVDEQVGWVIDILNWSQRLTFNSSLVLRHLTRFLYLGSSPYLAKKTLHLYIQVVGKAWEASKEGVGEDMDDDARWVETLVFGARMLCAGVGGQIGLSTSASSSPGQISIGDDGTEGIDDVQEARSILEKARIRLDENDKRLVAEVLLAEGIVWGLLGVKGQDPLTRPTNFDKAHMCLLQSIQAHPSPSAYYHLALSFARRIPGAGGLSDTFDSTVTASGQNNQLRYEYNLNQAIESAGHAVEGSPKDVRYWHLLGLLLSATEKWEAAKEILERGAELDNDEEIQIVENSEGGDSDSSDEHETNGGSEDAQTVMQMDMDARAIKVPGTNGTVNSVDMAKTSTTTTPRSKSNSIAITTSNGIHPRTSSNTSLNGNSISNMSAVLQISHVLLLQPEENFLPPAASLQHPLISILYANGSGLSVPSLPIDQYPPPTAVLFEQHLQLRMTQVALMEVVDGPEGAEEGWLEIFSWVAEKRGLSGGSTPAASSQPRQSLDAANPRNSEDLGIPNIMLSEIPQDQTNVEDRDQEEIVRLSTTSKHMYPGVGVTTSPRDINGSTSDSLPAPIGITISPATPETVSGIEQEVQLQLDKVEQAQLRVQSRRSFESLGEERNVERFSGDKGREREKDRLKEKEKKQPNAFSIQGKPKRSSSSDRDNRGDTSKSKKVQQMLKGSVHKGRAGINAVSRRIGNGVGKNGVLRRSTSTPDFHAVLQPMSYQASSIHSRRRLSSIAHSGENTPTDSPPPPPQPSLPSSATQQEFWARNQRSARQSRLLSDLWLMSAATFRRLGKIEQAKGSIQEAEVKDKNNPNVWVQLGLYYVALGLYQHAVDTLQKARFISSDDIGATVHLARLYLDPEVTSKIHSSSNNDTSYSPNIGSSAASSTGNRLVSSLPSISSPDVDLAAGMLAHLTKGRGWDVPEAWYFLAKAYGLQGRKEKERETLKLALEFSEKRGVRDIGSALGWCL